MGKKKLRKLRWYVHPEEEALCHGMGVWQPGAELPADALASLPPEVIINWKRNNLIIREDLFRLYFASEWNKRHGKQDKATPLDPVVKRGDEYTEKMSPEDTRTIT